MLALLSGIFVYLIELRRDRIGSANAFYIAMFAIVGGIIGSKLPIILIYWQELNSSPHPLDVFFSGRTIIGGLIGGALGTFFAKKLFHIKERLGNQIAIPVAVGMAVGRAGCLLRGCCYGQATSLPWGIDWGDHIARHPTQLYEMFFDILLALYLAWRKKQGVEPGELFKIFLNGYLSFRFFLEFIRVEKIAFMGLTDFQVLCVISLVYINRDLGSKLLNRKKVLKA